MPARPLPNGIPEIRGDLMDLPTILLLQEYMTRLEKIDTTVCEIVKILLDKIETLEAKIDDLQNNINKQ